MSLLFPYYSPIISLSFPYYFHIIPRLFPYNFPILFPIIHHHYFPIISLWILSYSPIISLFFPYDYSSSISHYAGCLRQDSRYDHPAAPVEGPWSWNDESLKFA
jgi:hypothetical protein